MHEEFDSDTKLLRGLFFGLIFTAIGVVVIGIVWMLIKHWWR